MIPRLLARPPRGLLRALLRVPVALDRLGLRRLLGGRTLVLFHRGRRTGRVIRTALEVMVSDPTRGEYVVMSAWGRESDWVRNIRAGPAMEVRVGRRRFTPDHEFLDADRALAMLEAYEHDHPRWSRFVWRVFGWDAEPDQGHLVRLVRSHPVVVFRPREDSEPRA